MKRIAAIVFAGCAAGGAAHAEDCAALAHKLQAVDFAKASPVRASSSATFAELYAECDETDTFAGRPLPTFRGKPLMCSTDPNRVTQLVQFPDKTVVFQAKASVDADGSPVSCGPNKSKTDQCQTWLTYDSESSRKFVDAEQVPFVVVPLPMPGRKISLMQATGIGKGDLAIALHNDRCTFAVVGDAGPYFRLGELSIAAHADLGNPQCRGREKPCTRLVSGGSGRGIPANVTYLIFPGTRPTPLTAENTLVQARDGSLAAFNRFIEAFQK
jgi:hypothetical protein